MLKTGICGPADLGRRRSMWGRSRQISLELMRAAGPTDGESDALFAEIMAPLRLPDGTYRTTARHRFAALDPVVNDILFHALDCSGEIIVHDWATSDGSAAMEWAMSLARRLPNLRFHASDKLLSVIRAQSPSGELYFCQPDGVPLQYVRRPFVISFREAESAAYPVNRFIARQARRKIEWLRSIVRALSWKSALDDAVIQRERWLFSQQPLLHPAVMPFAAVNKWLFLSSHSVFDVLVEPAHVIRSMNILNRAYFPEDRIAAGIRAVYESLRPGGIWIVGRSRCDQGGAVNADVFQKLDDRFGLLATIGEGSEIRALECQTATCEPAKGF